MTTAHPNVRTKDATRDDRAAASCDVCGRLIQQRGWINPARARLVREISGSYVHGRCL